MSSKIAFIFDQCKHQSAGNTVRLSRILIQRLTVSAPIVETLCCALCNSRRNATNKETEDGVSSSESSFSFCIIMQFLSVQ